MHTVIVGGGFAGVKSALELSKLQSGRVTLISARPYFLHHTALRLAAVGSGVDAAAINLDDIFASHPEVSVVIDTVNSLDPDRHLVIGKNNSYPYDNLIMALGSESTLPSSAHILGADSLAQARSLHDHLENTLATDSHIDHPFAIVGDGVAAVELTGAIASRARFLVEHHLTTKARAHIILAAPTSQILPDFSRQVNAKVSRRLKDLGVDIVLNQKIEPRADGLITINKRKIDTQSVIWTNTTKNNSFYSRHPQYFDIDKSGAVVVNPYLEAYRDIYVIGDNVNIGSGRVRDALDMASFIADHLVRRETGRLFTPYRQTTGVVSIPVGRNWAYIETLGIYVDGRIGDYIYNQLNYRSYRAILPKNMADAAVALHTTKKHNF
jgi:NADH:ubiquinone reductase (H+-translocating)